MAQPLQRTGWISLGTAVNGATNYILEIAAAPSFSEVVDFENTNPTISLTGFPEGTYTFYWRVAARTETETSPYSTSRQFTISIAEGGVPSDITMPCAPVNGADLYTTTISNHNAYVYTPQPNGAVNNVFRYRPMGTTDWLYTNTSMLYYRYLSDLIAGTD